jgi:hypothetical protein
MNRFFSHITVPLTVVICMEKLPIMVIISLLSPLAFWAALHSQLLGHCHVIIIITLIYLLRSYDLFNAYKWHQTVFC